MTGRLITLPARLYLRGARALVQAAEDVAGLAVTSTLRVAGALGNLRPSADGAPPFTSTPVREEPQQRRREPPRRNGHDPAAGERDPRSEPVPGRDAVTPPPTGNGTAERLAGERVAEEEPTAGAEPETSDAEAAHVSEEPVLVSESAEPGAEEGAGASITVHEPWEGYAQMNARGVISRLSGASSAELAAVQLYESGNRNRQTVLQAVERELRTAERGR